MLELTLERNFFCKQLSKVQNYLYNIISFICTLLICITAEKRFRMFCHTFYNNFLGMFRIGGVSRRINWIKVVYEVQKMLSLIKL